MRQLSLPCPGITKPLSMLEIGHHPIFWCSFCFDMVSVQKQTKRLRISLYKDLVNSGHSHLTVPFNNTQTVKFRSRPTVVSFYCCQFIVADVSKNKQIRIFSAVSKDTFLCSDWSTYLVFHGPLVVNVMMVDGNKKARMV